MTDNLPEPARPLSPAEVSWKVAQKIANTPFVPTAFRGKPESVYAAVLYGEELGLGPMQSLTQIHVIEGKPSLAPEGMRGLVLKAGHRIDVKTASNDKVVLYGRRADSGSEATVEWTMKDAQLAGLAGRGAWKTYPRAMLMARATSELCRMLFADIIAGLSYTPEEVMSISGQEYVMVAPETPQTALDAPETPAEPEPAEIVLENVTAPSAVAEPEIEVSWEEAFPDAVIHDAEIVEDKPATPNTRIASAKQLNMIRAIARGAGIDQDELPALVSGIVGRDINVLQAIQMGEVDQIISHLRTLEAS
ncbi:MAG: hypothetical protein ACO395_08405 [Pontimonas sp.]